MLSRAEFDVARIHSDTDYIRLFDTGVTADGYFSSGDGWVNIHIDDICTSMSIGESLFQVYDDFSDSGVKVFIKDQWINVETFGYMYSYIDSLVGKELIRELWRLYDKYVSCVVEQVGICMELA